MDLDFNTRIKRLKRFKELPSKNVVLSSDIYEEYPHLTFHINSLLEYLQIIKLLKTGQYTDQTLVFRGMSQSDWLAVPSLARYEGYDETIEYKMVNEFMALRPEAFQGLRSNFEILSKMQHYGLPTRLLDFTTNPLVALYFACADKPKNEARVLCSSTYLTDAQNKIVESICGSCKQYDLVNFRIEDLLISTGLTPYEYIGRLYLQNDFRPVFVKPWYWNQRIINQRAIFLVFANALFDHLGKIVYYKEQLENDKDDVALSRQIHKIAESEMLDQIYPVWHPSNPTEAKFEKWREEHLSSEEKQPIRRDFSVTHDTIKKLFSFHQRAEIIQRDSGRYTLYGQTILGERFLLREYIDTIDTDSMKTMFCSIIVDKKAKKGILSDLESIGIDKAFIYPELEYTAEKIKRKYF